MTFSRLITLATGVRSSVSLYVLTRDGVLKRLSKKDPINELLKIYVKFHEEAEKHPELDDEARGYFKKLEDGDEETTALWTYFRDISLVEFKRVYNMLGVKFDSYNGEAFYSDKMDEVVDILRDKGLLTESDGAQVVDLSELNITALYRT